MNTFDYVKHLIRDEFRAILEEARDVKIVTICFILAIIGLIFYLKPFPNRHIYFSSGSPNSDWYVKAESIAATLNESGLKVDVLPSVGAVENVLRVNNQNEEVNAGFTYGIAVDKNEINNIYSLGSVAYEPVWILYNKSRIGEINSLEKLAQYKVGLAPVKSGSYRIAKKIFEVINIDVENRVNFQPDSTINNAIKLKKGKIDVFIVVSTNLDYITEDLMYTSGIAVFDFKNAPAYAKKFNSFVTLTMPADSININQKIPKKDLTLLATTTSLVVKRTMHPDLQLAVLIAAKDANRNSSNLFFAKRNEFPAYLDPLIPISPVAEHFYDYGPPHAMRYLPYWLAGLVDRAWLLLLTILAIFYPISKLNSHVRKFRFSLREIPHYRELLEIEKRLCDQKLSPQDKVEMLERLDSINEHAIHGGVPINEEASYFEFLNAIYLLKRKINGL